VIGAAIEVHRHLGPGLLEVAYEEALAYELEARRIPFRRPVMVPIAYKDASLSVDLRIDLLIDDSLVLELKAVERILPVHKAQLLTYLRLSNYSLGLLLNFNVGLMRDGIDRVVNGLQE